MTDLASEAAPEAAVDALASEPDPASEKRVARTTREVVETLVATILWSYLWSMLLTIVLNQMHAGWNIKWLIGHDLYNEFRVFVLSAAVVWVVVLLVLALSGRIWLTCGLALSAAIGLGFVDQTKMRMRLEPVYPSDLDFLRSPGFLFSMVNPGRLVLAVLVMVAITLLVARIGRIPQRTFRPIRRASTPKAWRFLVIARVATAILCVLTLNYARSFNAEDNKIRHAFESGGAHWAFWYQDMNYKLNGVVAGLLYNMLAEPMQPPVGYSKATMEQIATRWQAAADRINESRTADFSDVNVVSLLSEAFSDPSTVKGTSVQGDPIPYTRNLMTKTTSGTMLAQLYGGGTANMEFEALTGQSLAVFDPQVNTPYQQFVHNQPDYSTIAGYLQRTGHRAIAIHPYMTAMYQRGPVYKTFGFESFIHDTTMHETKKLDHNKFISDESAFEEVTRQIDATAEPLFINLVTMQNHVPLKGTYKNPWPVTAPKGQATESLGGYARGINYTDEALKDLLEDLSSSKEKTAVVFYGDHRPGIYPAEVTRQNSEIDMKSTPFFIWTNFETPKVPTAALTSPIYFMPLLFEQADAKVPPWYALLTEMYRKVPAMEQGVRFDWAGRDDTHLDSVTEGLLEDYRMIQYDMSVGKRYAADTMFYRR